jgi:hypothetical protein
MNTVGVRSLSLAIFLSFAVAAVEPIMEPMIHAAPQPAQAGSINLSKDVMDKKNVIVWKDAPAGTIPSDVCNILQSCGGKIRGFGIPAATEGGVKVTRVLFLTSSADGKTDEVVLARQTVNDRYFYLVGAAGNLQKAAFVQLGSTQWLPVAVSIVQPQFDKEKQIWHDRLIKFGAPAAAPAAGN